MSVATQTGDYAQRRLELQTCLDSPRLDVSAAISNGDLMGETCLRSAQNSFFSDVVMSITELHQGRLFDLK